MALTPTAIEFAGGNQYIDFWNGISIKNLDTFSFWCWVKPATVTDTTTKMVYAERQGTGQQIRFGVTAYLAATKGRSGYLRFLFGPKDGVAPSHYAFPTNIWSDLLWHHIMFSAVLHPSTGHPSYEICLDGTKVAGGNLILPSGTTKISNTTPIAISGGVLNGRVLSSDPILRVAGTYWSGKIADVAIFNAKKLESDARTYIGNKDFNNRTDTSMIADFRLTDGTGENTGATFITECVANNTATTPYYAGAATPLLWTVDRPFLGSGLNDTTHPTNFTNASTPTTAITSTSFTANWNATTDDVYVQYYELQVATVSNFASYVSYNSGVATNFNVTALIPSTNYYWRVRAFDAASNASGYTSTVSLTTSSSGDITAPSTPTQNAVSSISFDGYTLHWSAATDNIAIGGYKIDVGLDSHFNTYLSGFVNRDVGNVTTFPVTGTVGTTNYYSRVRAYDTSGNESGSSNVIKTKTSPPPDTIDPNTVDQAMATSVTAESFVANWLPAVDNVGVVNYYLDVGFDENFTTHVTGYNNLSVGDVLAYPVTGLTAETLYYYRTRAADAAGNISSNTDTPMVVTTDVESIVTGGFVTSLLSPIADAYVDSANATTNYGTATTLNIAGNGTTATKIAYVEFDLSTIQGQIENAFLSLYVDTATTSDVTITGPASLTTINEGTVTYTLRPTTITGDTVVFDPITAAELIQVDVSSLITLGNVVYTFAISMTDASSAIFDAREGTNPPQITVISDPTVITSLLPIEANVVAGLRTNYSVNPSAEVNTTGWQATGSGAVLSRSTSDAVVGSACFQLVGNSAAVNQGIMTNGNVIPAVIGQTWSISFWAKVTTGSLVVNAGLQENANTGIQITVQNTSITLTTAWRKFKISKTLNQTGVSFVGFWLACPTLATFTMRLDKVQVTQGGLAGAYFDGNTAGATWSGTANNSISTIGGGEFALISPYLGDANDNNTAVVAFRRSDADSDEWINHSYIDTNTVVNHSTQQVTAPIGNSYGDYNLITNPSFEVNANRWIASGTGVSIALNPDFVDGSQCLLATYTNDSGNRTVMYAPTDVQIQAMLNDHIYFSIYLRSDSPGVPVNLVIQEATTTWTSAITVSDEWERYSFLVRLQDVATTSVSCGFAYATATVANIYADNAMAQKATYLVPYLDGDSPDGVWEGVPHASVSGLTLTPETSYDFQVTYTDPDGVIPSLDGNLLSGNAVGTYSTAAIPINSTITASLLVTPSDSYLTADVYYFGDDNHDNSILFEWKRTDVPTWYSVTTVYDRTNYHASALISDLAPGISYTVRATFSDPDNISGTFGVNPLYSTVITTTADIFTATSSLITFGGFVLQGRNDGIIGVDSHDAFGLPTRRLDVQDLARVDGATETSDYWGRREITMTGFVAGTSRANLYSNLAILKQALAVGRQPLVIDTLSNSRRYYTATVTALTTSEVAGTNYVHLTWSATFMCADPFAYDAHLEDTTFSATDSNTIALTNTGSVPVDMVFSVTTTNTSSPCTVTVTNNSTGERITPNNTILSGDKFLFDGTKTSMLKNGVPVDYWGGFPKLLVGSNILQFNVIPTASVIQVHVQWRQRYM